MDWSKDCLVYGVPEFLAWLHLLPFRILAHLEGRPQVLCSEEWFFLNDYQ